MTHTQKHVQMPTLVLVYGRIVAKRYATNWLNQRKCTYRADTPFLSQYQRWSARDAAALNPTALPWIHAEYLCVGASQCHHRITTITGTIIITVHPLHTPPPRYSVTRKPEFWFSRNPKNCTILGCRTEWSIRTWNKNKNVTIIVHERNTNIILNALIAFNNVFIITITNRNVFHNVLHAQKGLFERRLENFGDEAPAKRELHHTNRFLIDKTRTNLLPRTNAQPIHQIARTLITNNLYSNFRSTPHSSVDVTKVPTSDDFSQVKLSSVRSFVSSFKYVQ